MSGTGADRANDRSRLRLLLATSSLTALLIAGGAPSAWATQALTQSQSCDVAQSGTAGSVSNSAPSGNCILIENANISGNVTNTSTGILTATGETSFRTGIIITNSTVGGAVGNAGTILAERTGILVINDATVSSGISNSGIISAGSNGISVGFSFGEPTSLKTSDTTVSVANFSGGISNSGKILAGGNGIFVGGGVSSSGVTVTIANVSGGITNSGMISAQVGGEDGPGMLLKRAEPGGANGIWVGGLAQVSNVSFAHVTISTFSGNISNSGMISTNGNGVWVGGNASTEDDTVGEAAASVTISLFAGNISNSGMIAGGNGIIVGGSASKVATVTILTFSGGISNSGTVGAGGHGIAVGGDAFSGGAVTIGTFTGGISNSGLILQEGGNSQNGFGGGTTAESTANFVGATADFVGNENLQGRGSAIFVGGVADNSGNSSSTIKISTFLGGINNSGTISAQGYGIWVGGLTRSNDESENNNSVVISAFYNGITNSGTILAGGHGIFVGGVASSSGTVKISTFSGGINNSGTVVAGGNGIWVGGTARSDGMVTIGTFSGGIINSGTIIAGGNGIFVGGFADSGGTVTISTFSGDIRNSGTIAAATGDGILVSGVTNFSGRIINTGTISGDVGIEVTNSGAVSLFDSGTIIGTSGTAVSFAGTTSGNNTFTLGPGYSITGNVIGAGSDTFQLGGTGNGSFNLSAIGSSQQYQGFSTFNVVGGVWNTSGTFDIGTELTWTVQSGTLAGASTFGTSTNPVSILIQGGGALEPGNIGQPGTVMNVTGNLRFQPGAAYVVTVGSNTASRANVSGSVFLNGVVEGVLMPTSYTGGTPYDILSAASISGTFSNFNSVNAPGFGGTVNVEGDPQAVVNLTAQLGSGGGLNQNQQNVATSINNFFNNCGTLPASFFPLFTLTGGTLANALTQIDGEDATGAERAAFDQMNEFLGLMLDPFVDGRGGGSGAVPALGFSRDEQDELPADVALAYAHLLKAPAARPAPVLQPSWTTWAAGFGSSATTNGDPTVGSNNVTASTYGYAAGMDYHYSPNTVLGFSIAGGGTNWNLANALGTGSSDSFLLGVYGVTHEGPWYIGGALAFANNWFTTNRTAFAGDQLNASFQGQDYAARLEGGYRYVVSLDHHAVGVTPYAALQAQDFHTPAYSETDLSGGGFGLSYNAMNGTDTRSELGSRFDDLAAIANMPLLLRAKVAWAHDWTSNPSLNASFESLPGASFTVNGAPIPQDSALTSVGAQLWFMPNWSLLAKFDGEFASGSQTYAGSGTVRYTW